MNFVPVFQSYVYLMWFAHLFSIVLQYCLKCESTGKTLSTGPSPSRRFVGGSSDSTVRGVRLVDPRQCSVARAVIMEHYRILGLACVVPGPGHCSGGNRGELAG